MGAVSRRLLCVLMILAVQAVPLWAGPLNTLHQFNSFGGSDSAANPYGGVVTDGVKLYGTGLVGGINGQGAVYSLNVDGTGYQTLHSFGISDGSYPQSSLLLIGSTLYGTTERAVSAGATGRVFSINTTGGSFQVLHSFANAEGIHPLTGVVAIGSRLFGMTRRFGANDRGAIYALDTNGANFQATRAFTTSDGAPPPYAGLTVVGDRLFGTASDGTAGSGEIFSVLPDGTDFQVVYNFTAQDFGKDPRTTMLLAGDTLFGTTFAGGSSNLGTIFSMNIDGSSFQRLKSFDGGDGSGPIGGMAQIGNRLYGTTVSGGSADVGTLFSIGLDGTDFRVMHHFSGAGTDGGAPIGALTAHGLTLYGTTSGGALGYGTVFEVTVPEPSSMLLAALGAIGCTTMIVRRRR